MQQTTVTCIPLPALVKRPTCFLPVCANIFCVFCKMDELDTSTLCILVGDMFHQGIFIHILSHLKPVNLTCFMHSICLCSYKRDVTNDEISYLQQMAHVQIHLQTKGPLCSDYLPTIITNITAI